jgi:hypothetical protein
VARGSQQGRMEKSGLKGDGCLNRWEELREGRFRSGAADVDALEKTNTSSRIFKMLERFMIYFQERSQRKCNSRHLNLVSHLRCRRC